MTDLSKFEPLLDDDRVAVLAQKIKSEFGHGRLEGSDFVTFIQPAREVERKTPAGVTVRSWIGDMCVFGVISDNPRSKGHRLMTHATVSMEGWREAEQERQHFAGRPDPAHGIFRLIAKNHLPTIQNLKDMI